jgi:hypothetical protein
MATTTGVFPCYENQFKVNVSATSTANYVTIADCETFEVSFDNGVEEWTPFDSEGWVRRLMTAKNITITVSGKRNIGDAGNNYIAGLAFANGRDAEVDFQWTFKDGTVVQFTGSPINVTALGSGDSTAVAPLEFEILSNGKPTVTPASVS